MQEFAVILYGLLGLIITGLSFYFLVEETISGDNLVEMIMLAIFFIVGVIVLRTAYVNLQTIQFNFFRL